MIADELKLWREKWEMSQAEAAAALGVPIRTYQNWEQGTRSPQGLSLQAV